MLFIFQMKYLVAVVVLCVLAPGAHCASNTVGRWWKAWFQLPVAFRMLLIRRRPVSNAVFHLFILQSGVTIRIPAVSQSSEPCAYSTGGIHPSVHSFIHSFISLFCIHPSIHCLRWHSVADHRSWLLQRHETVSGRHQNRSRHWEWRADCIHVHQLRQRHSPDNDREHRPHRWASSLRN